MYKFSKSFRLVDALAKIQFQYSIINGDQFACFDNIAPIMDANDSSICFIGNEKINKIELISCSNSKIIITSIDSELPSKFLKDKIIVNTDSPRTLISRIIKTALADSLEENDFITSDSNIARDATIGDKTTIGKGSRIGKAHIGKNCKIMNNVVINDNCQIGDNVYIGNNCVIGESALSLILNEKQTRNDGLPQLGGVNIHSGVYIASFCSIQKGTFGNTIIGENVAIDSFVLIAHNVQIGDGSKIFGHSKISGSVKVGKNVIVGQSSTVGNIGSIGDGAFIGMGSVVIYNVEENSKVFGNPARRIHEPKI